MQPQLGHFLYKSLHNLYTSRTQNMGRVQLQNGRMVGFAKKGIFSSCSTKDIILID